MGVAEGVRLLRLRVSPSRLAACVYLERHGFRFLVDFGYQNATDLALAHRRERRKTLRGKS